MSWLLQVLLYVELWASESGRSLRTGIVECSLKFFDSSDNSHPSSSTSVDRFSLYSEPFARSDDPEGDFASVGDQDFPEHLSGSSIRGCFRAFGEAGLPSWSSTSPDS